MSIATIKKMQGGVHDNVSTPAAGLNELSDRSADNLAEVLYKIDKLWGGTELVTWRNSD